MDLDLGFGGTDTLLKEDERNDVLTFVSSISRLQSSHCVDLR
jgi:hypothetical protein